jgi:hypothetical protein
MRPCRRGRTCTAPDHAACGVVTIEKLYPGLIQTPVPAETVGMAIRRQTVALLVVLSGAVVLLALHDRSRAPEGGSKPPYYATTPVQASATFAKLKTPRGFSPSRRECPAEDLCFYRAPSVVLSSPRIVQWLSEAGLSRIRRSLVLFTNCPTIHQRTHAHLLLMVCTGFQANEGPVVIGAYANSVLLKGPHGPRATTALLGNPRTGFKGTELDLLDDGVPTP